MSPEITPEITQRTMSGEIIDIETARFADRLAPEYEQAWEELIALGKETKMTIEKLMTPVWREETLPQVFRDRAMLLVVGTDETRKALGQESCSTNGSFAFEGVTVSTFQKVVSDFDPALFCTWSREAQEYQRTAELPIISNGRYLCWQYEFYERGLISEEELGDFVDNIDITASSPRWGGSGWDGDSYPLDQNRFPILSDIFNARTTPDDAEKMRTWAVECLEDWLSYQNDTSLIVPDWLKEVPPEIGRKLYQQLINGGDKSDWLDWDAVRSAVDYFGLDIFGSRTSKPNLRTVYAVKDPSIREELLKVILVTQKEKAISGDSYRPLGGTSYSIGSEEGRSIYIEGTTIMQEVIDETDDPELKELFDLELMHVAEYEERSVREQEERMRGYKAEHEASPGYQEQQRARAAFLSRVTGLANSKS